MGVRIETDVKRGGVPARALVGPTPIARADIDNNATVFEPEPFPSTWVDVGDPCALEDFHAINCALNRTWTE
jgi:hypothetical protein